MKTFEALKQRIASVEKDAEKFYIKGNKSAGVRLRSVMQEAKRLSQRVRAEVLNRRK